MTDVIEDFRDRWADLMRVGRALIAADNLR
jgi:hypothetical protein